MKSIFLLLISLYLTGINVSAQEDLCTASDSIRDPNLVTLFAPAEFPGGVDSLLKFINTHLRYPEGALEKGIGGLVVARIIIEKDGSIGEMEIDQGIGYGCDQEVLRVIRLMPKWKPALLSENETTRVAWRIPIRFTNGDQLIRENLKLAVHVEDTAVAAFIDKNYTGGLDYFSKQLSRKVSIAGYEALITEETALEISFVVNAKGAIAKIVIQWVTTTSGNNLDISTVNPNNLFTCEKCLKRLISEIRPSFDSNSDSKSAQLIRLKVVEQINVEK
jgi:TonB family protein